MDIPVNQTRAYTCCNEYESLFSYDKREKYCNWTCGDMIYAIIFLADNIFIVLAIVFLQLIGIPMGANSAPLC
jgi:hypothetical protein